MKKNVYWFTYPLSFGDKSKLESSPVGRDILAKISLWNASVQSNKMLTIFLSFVVLCATFAVATFQQDYAWIVWFVGIFLIAGIIILIKHLERKNLLLDEQYEKFVLAKARCDDDTRAILDKMENGE